MMANENAQPRRAVIPIVSGVGNALMAIPMVRQLKRLGGTDHVTIIARNAAMAEPFRRLAEVDEVLVTGKGAAGYGRLLRWTRQRRADVYLVPFPSNRWQYGLLALTSGARRAILHRYPIGRVRALGFVGQRVPAVRGLHDVVQNLRLLRALDLQPDETESPEFIVNDGDRARATTLLQEASLSSRTPFIAIHPGSATTILAAAKRWPPERYAELIRQLRAELPDEEVVLLEGPDETGVADEIHAQLGADRSGVTVIKLIGPLGDAAALLERATLYAGSDSGLAHLAAAVGTRTVTIFAPADPDRVCPYGNRELVVKCERPCSPCFMCPWEATHPKMKCAPPFCVAEISAERVMAAVRRVSLMHPLPTGLPRAQSSGRGPG